MELVALRRVAPRGAAQWPSGAAHSVRSTRTGLSQRDKHHLSGSGPADPVQDSRSASFPFVCPVVYPAVGAEFRLKNGARSAHPITAIKWLSVVQRLALRAVAPSRAARRLRPPGVGSDSSRPLCAGGVVAARPLPPPNGHAIAGVRMPPAGKLGRTFALTPGADLVSCARESEQLSILPLVGRGVLSPGEPAPGAALGSFELKHQPQVDHLRFFFDPHL